MAFINACSWCVVACVSGCRRSASLRLMMIGGGVVDDFSGWMRRFGGGFFTEGSVWSSNFVSSIFLGSILRNDPSRLACVYSDVLMWRLEYKNISFTVWDVGVRTRYEVLKLVSTSSITHNIMFLFYPRI
ncbi:hypothetical protein L484_015594 [Morus notabilis]|uniref:Uncharacterized protein n=1 Tax=Morus notabilis TaxID=981085 RepID=W9SAY9_9ROSA|nr:hypothetical protein L484_015594 [Morus notabilis]